ncbi:hypothetical protein [Streptomyces aquilus]|uniref:hypothetical protein n=1 Tax=Streptomyces aquilus TaxID=2548456 RepID=UPI0036AA5354
MKTDLPPQPSEPGLRRMLDEAVMDCTPPAFPREGIVRRAAAIRRRRRLAAASVAALLLIPVAGKLALDQDASSSRTVSGADSPTTLSSASSETGDAPSPVRVVRPGERIDVGLGMWYLLKKREYCPKHPLDPKPSCVGPLDVDQPGVPMALSWYPFPQGVVSVFVYTGKTPATRITMTQHGRTTLLPLVRLPGRPSFVSSYAISAPVGDDERKRLVRPTQGPVFRVYGADGAELAEMRQ